MFADEVVSLSAQQLLVGASIGFIVLAFFLWQIYYVPARRSTDDQLSDGAVLLISDGVVQQASPAAVKMLGECQNQPIVRVLDDFFGADATDARDAVNRLEMTGDPVDMLVHTPDHHAYELIGEPAGGLIRLVLRDAELLDVKLRDAAERISAADSALLEHQWEQATLSGLIEEAPIIAWNRTAEGVVNWSGGEIKVRNSSIQAAQAVDLIVARTKLNRVPVLAGQPQKSRIEIVVNDGADTISLHVLEIIRQDGTRMGFATDAGTAASAERTVTRFVQTMTETFAHLTVGLAIFDRNQTLALFNPALVQMWQVEPTWLARRPSLRDIIDELRSTRRLPELQDFHKWRSRILGLFENTEAADYEELWHLADGSNIRVLARPHPHGSLAFIFDDVTERVRLEQRYRHSIDLRRATLDRLNEGVAVFGANGLLQFVNQAFHEIWGTDGESVYAAMHARQLVGLCEQLTVDASLWPRLHNFITGEESRRAWTEPLIMGSGRQLQARIAPLPDGSTMIVFNDSSDQAAERMSERSKPQDVAEKVETLFAKLEKIVDAPQAGASEAQDEHQVRPAREELVALKEQLESLLVPVDPIGSGHMSEPFANNALRSSIATLHERAEAMEVDFRTDYEAGDSSKVPGDLIRVRQVIFTLAQEALNVSVPGGSVILSASGDGEAFSIQVTATRTEESAQDLDSSSGLAIARRFASRDSGSIEVQPGTDAKSIQYVCRFRPLNGGTSGDDAALEFSKDVHPLTPKAIG